MRAINTYTMQGARREKRNYWPLLIGLILGIVVANLWAAIPEVPSRFGGAGQEAIR